MNKVLGVVFCCLFLASCGFEPLYAHREEKSSWYFGGKFDNSVTTEMEQIKVEPIADRFGQQVRNELLDLMTPRGMPAKPKYRLFVQLKSKNVIQQALRRDITATRERVEYKVTYRLESSSYEKGINTLVSGNSVAFVSYDLLENPFSTTMAQKKTEADAAKIIANDIVLRMGAYFHKELTNQKQQGGLL